MNRIGRTRLVQLMVTSMLLVGARSLLTAQPSSPPTISSIPDQGVYPNATSRVIHFIVSDAESPPQQLTVTGRAADTNLIPDSGLIFGGNKENRTLTIIPAPGQTGVTTVSVVVTDPQGGAATNSFKVDVAYFTPVPSDLPALGGGQAVWGDYDNDGWLDVLMTGSGTNGTSTYIFRNNGDGTFTQVNAGLTSSERGMASWVDYNRDGWLDVLLTGGYPQIALQLYRNDGGGVFTPVACGLPYIHDGGSFGGVAWGDYDNDGAPDLAFSGRSTNLTPSTFVYRNNGDGTFANVQAGLPGADSGSLDWGDYDNDGDLDLVLCGRGTDYALFTKLFRNDGKHVFSEVATNFPGVWFSTTLWGDYDNDGDLDLLITGRDTDWRPRSWIYRNNGGVFVDIGAALVGVSFGQTAWADFDNDGDLDVILGGLGTSGAPVTRLYRNNGNESFTEVNAGLTNIHRGSYAWGDYDNDGDLDLLVLGYACYFSCPVVQLYRNNGPSNAAPSAPGGLSATVLQDNDVLLRWNASTDSQTPSKGLSYNLRVGTNSGGIQIISPCSDLATGFRRVPQSGSAHTNCWQLVDLPKGTYYWSVQAVDTAFAGSLFSTQAVFAVTNSRPFISAIPDQVTFPNVAVSNISFTIGDAETPAASLVVTKSSANTSLLPQENIILGGAGSNRTVTLIPTGNRGGGAVVTLTVRDTGGLTKSTSFALRVEAFTRLASIGPPERPSTVAALYHSWVDYDADGDLDVLFSRLGYDPGLYREVLVLRNEGAGVFTPVDAGFGDFFITSAAWGDVDNDGYPDLFATGEVAGAWPYAARLYRNNGNGSFTQSPMQFPPVRFGSVSVADINGDGSQDLFLVGPTNNVSGSDVLKIYLNDGRGAFSEWETDLPVFSIYAGSSQWGDVDNDGDHDLMIGDGRLFRNDGGGKFTDITSRIPPPPWGENSVNWADFDNDGDLDILVAGTTNVICRNRGDGMFDYVASGITNIRWGTSVVLVDYNNDGWMDVVLNPNGGSLFQNDGNLTFTLVATNVSTGIWGDYDNEGDLDVLAGGVIYRNNTAVPNTPPAAPYGLNSVLQLGASIVLSWVRPTDPQTTNANGLDYNLRVGTVPGGVDVVSPLAQTMNGVRRVVQRGNAGSTNYWVLRDLPRGTYYWAVQAIDTGFAGSPFSTNATFKVSRPKISAIQDQMVAPGFAPPPISFTVFDGETAVSNLVLSVSCSNTNLVALTNIVFSGSGSNRTVSITPTPGQRGTNVITITVTDGDGFTDSATFKLIVMPFLRMGNLAVGASSRVFPADYNNDGLIDVLAIGSTVQLWRNLGGGNFTNDATGLPASNNGPAAWGDYDNDGWLDLVFTDSTNVFRNTGSNHFIAVPTSMSPPGYFGQGNSTVSWGDYDGDGRLDLMRMGWGYVELFRNLGGGMFTNSGITPQWGQVGSIGWADLNNDGELDLVVSGDFTGGGSFCYIYRGMGGAGLTLVVSNSIVGVRCSTVAFRDFDADGDLDILLAGDRTFNGNATCRVYRNDGNFIFTNYIELATDTVRNAAWGDYNNDGRPDVLAYGAQATTVLVNNGDGTFTDIQADLPTVGVNGAAWADFDNDGDLDILADRLYVNLRPITNQSPLQPSDLQASFASNTVVLSWSAPADDTTRSNALTFAVRLGMHPGGSQILTPDADLVTGLRRAVPEINTWPNRFRMVKNLPDGIYYWSVQAIDSGYAGSLFAAETNFSYFHPSVVGPSNILVFPTGPAPVVNIIVGDADSAADSLRLTAFSSNPSLLNSTNIVFGGSGSNRTATLNFTPGLAGTSIVAIVVTDVTGLTATNSFRFESSYFTDVTPVFSGGNLFNGKWADFDNDNDLDLYLGGTIYRNDGGLTFTAVGAVLSGERKGVCWADYDRDGDLDLASVGAGNARIYRNDGNGTFTDINARLQGVYWAAAAWGDFDNDGRPDLLVSGSLEPNTSTPFTALYRNAGNDQFVLVAGTGLPAARNSSVAWGDIDNDGRLDVLINGLGIGPLSWFAEIYRNNGHGTFTGIGAGFTGGADGAVDLGDYDNDGDLDALVTGFNQGTYVLRVYRNNGNRTFTQLMPALQGIQYGDATWVDFDNDGWLDILVTGCTANYCDSYTTRIYANNRDGTFSSLDVGLPNIAGQPAAWGDFDNDGDLDLFLGRLYRNNAFLSNAPPTAPVGLAAEILPNNDVRLRWAPSSDEQNTNPAGLSYAVRVGTIPGGLDYVSPHADPGSGYRRLPVRGPAATNEFLLRDVPKGNYFWSVQAIDAGLVGSPFSVEASFAITNARPWISAISNQVTVPGRATAPISFTVSDLETPPDELILNGYSTNTTLVPNSNIVFAGGGSNRTVTVTPANGLSGTTIIEVAVTDSGGLTTTSRFELVVQMFNEVAVGLPSGDAVASALGDYDNDGDLDIAVTGPQYGSTTVYRNNNGCFANQNFNLPAAGYYLTAADLAWIDFDNDGDLDLTASGWIGEGYRPVTFRFRNNFPTNSFTTISTNLPGTGVTNIANGAMAWGDYDNDGDLDVFLAGDPDTYHSVDAFSALYRNDGGIFTNSGAVFPTLVRGAAAWGDYDNDGDIDLLIAGQTGSVSTNSVTKLFRNDGNGVFSEVATPFPGITDCAVAFGDMDNDGDLDIAIAGTATNSAPLTQVYRNLGNGVFTNVAADLLGATFASLAWGDFDNDGFADLAVSGWTNTSPYNPAAAVTRVYRNNGGVSFTEIGDKLPGVGMVDISWGDYDNDGDLDLLGGTRLLRNNWNIPNTPPSTPTNLSAFILPHNAVLLMWAPSTDLETTNSSGLSYNLRLGTTPGGAEIISPCSDPVSGYHRVPQRGNAGQTNAWVVFNLTNGTYYWSVQAIDAAFAGSPFATESRFTLSRPIISVITNLSAMPNSVVGPIAFAVSDAETAASNLLLTAYSSNTNLVPNENLLVGGLGTNRTLTIIPVTNRSGIATITILATDENGETGTRSFTLTVERFADIGAGLGPAVGPVAWGDCDNDGDFDLVHGGTIYLNFGNNVFTNLPVNLLCNEGYGGWADYDNDGNIDLLAVGANATVIYRGDGNGGFSNINAGLPPAVNPRQCGAWGDYDNDGDADVLIVGGGFARLYRNDGSNVFTNIGGSLATVVNGAAAWADYDEDGDLDILLAGSGLLRIYRNDGNGTFTDIGANLPGLFNPSVAWGDFDNDGDPDFVVAGSTNNAVSGVVTRIYRNTGHATPALRFTNLYPIAAQGPVGVWKGTVAWGDYDNDGDLDLLVTGESTNGVALTRLYRNDGGAFTESGHWLPGLKNSFAAWGDFDNDGHLDLALSGNLASGAAASRVYRNFPAEPPNTPPNSPGQLSSVVVGKSVRLYWDAARDPNQTGGLSYNLRVGTSPGAGDVLNPISHNDGVRKVVAHGNAGGQLVWVITNLVGGVYYWSVQAVDHSFAGSAFATEASFVISNLPPLVTNQFVTTIEDGPCVVTLTATDPDGDPLTFRIVSAPLFGRVIGTPPRVTYLPLTNYFGFDQFRYVANDRTTDSEPGTVFVEITPVEDVTASILGIRPEPDGTMLLLFNGEPWRSYRIEVSEDLIHWEPLTNFICTELPMVLVDPCASAFDHRFYRAAGICLAPELDPGSVSELAGFSFTLRGESGRNYRIQASTNLTDWVTIGHLLQTNALSHFMDADAARFSHRFYRVVAP